MKRLYIQITTFILTNINISGFINGTIFKGKTKFVCVPGLNCYSCPGAVGSCPIGALQAVLGSAKQKIGYYVLGLLILFGATMGRWICGFLCPFGLLQDLLYKIKSRKIGTLIIWLSYSTWCMYLFHRPVYSTMLSFYRPETLFWQLVYMWVLVIFIIIPSSYILQRTYDFLSKWLLDRKVHRDNV